MSVEPLMPHGPFYRCPYNVSGPGNIAVALLFMEVRELSDLIKNILICVQKMNEGLTGLERHEGE